MTGLVAWLTLGTALGCGLCAGVFFAFSAFVMPALGRLPAGQGIAAMQSINKLAVTPAFMTALFGSALACAGLAAASNSSRVTAASIWKRPLPVRIRADRRAPVPRVCPSSWARERT